MTLGVLWYSLISMDQPETAPEISVIVPARNEEACLADCLRSLVGQAGPAYELIVVDDHSTDGPRAIAESFPLKLREGGGCSLPMRTPDTRRTRSPAACRRRKRRARTCSPIRPGRKFAGSP